MKLTCVTAVFNALKSGHRESLIRCVESVAKLKTEHEHLIYDGASTDGTVELLRELEAKTPGLKVVSEPDTGIYNALNKGVRDAMGEWFYVLGCDDYICNADVMDDLIIGAEDATKLIVAPVDRECAPYFFRKNSDLYSILWRFPYSHQSVIMRADLVRHFGGFDERFKICADWDMLMKCHQKAFEFEYHYVPFAYFSVDGASAIDDYGEQDRIHAEFLGLTDGEFSRYLRFGVFPIWKLLPYLFHGDRPIRVSAWIALGRSIKPFVRIPLYPIVLVRRTLQCRGVF